LRLHLAISLSYLGREILAKRGLSEAEPHCLRALEILSQLAAREPAYRMYLAGELAAWGEMLVQSGRREQASRAFQEAVDTDPTSAHARNSLARLLASRPDLPAHDPARAVELARAVVAQVANEAGYWNTLGIALARTGDWEAAERAFEKSTSLDKEGGNPADWLFLAMIEARRGDVAQARKILDRSDAWLHDHAYAQNDPDLLYFRTEAAAQLEPTWVAPVISDSVTTH
jgi:Flp pilus assembly protein TadD